MGNERFDLESIHNKTLTEDIVHKYRDGLARVCNSAELHRFLDHWEPIAPTAREALAGLSESDVKRFLRALKRDKSGKGSLTDPVFLDIALPSLLLIVTGMAHQYSVPFGAAFRRMVDLGMILVEDGVASLEE